MMHSQRHACPLPVWPAGGVDNTGRVPRAAIPPAHFNEPNPDSPNDDFVARPENQTYRAKAPTPRHPLTEKTASRVQAVNGIDRGSFA